MSKLVTISLVVGLVSGGMLLTASNQNHIDTCERSKARIEQLKNTPPKTHSLGYTTMDELETTLGPTCTSLSTEDFVNSVLGGLLIAFGFYPLALIGKFLLKLEKKL